MTNNRIQLEVTEKIRETERTATILLKDSNGFTPYRAGQFLTLIFDDLGPAEIRRSYSMSSAPNVDHQLAITVKKVPNGTASRYLVDSLHPGDLLTALEPSGRFTIEAQSAHSRDIFLIGGGSGVTPLFSLIKYLLREEPQSRLMLINANRDEDSIIFRDQLTRLANAYPYQFHAIHYLSEPKASLEELSERLAPVSVRWGRLSNALIEDLITRNMTHQSRHAQFFLCGPPGLLLKAENTIGFMGFSPAQIRREVFTIIPAYRPEPDQFPRAQVHLRWDGENYRFPVLPGQNILEAAQKAGIDLPYSCRSGSCTTCSAQCRTGKIEMYTQNGRITTDMTNGLTLTCVGYPLTEKVELEIG